MEFAKDKVRELSGSKSTLGPHHCDPVQSALSISVVLEHIFRYLNQDALKVCREVCQVWAETAQKFSHPVIQCQMWKEEAQASQPSYPPNPIIRLIESAPTTICKNIPKFANIWGIKVESYEVTESNFLPSTEEEHGLNVMKKLLQSLQLDASASKQTRESWADQYSTQGNLSNSNWRFKKELEFNTIGMNTPPGVDGTTLMTTETLILLEIIKRAPELRQLYIEEGTYSYYSTGFYDTLLEGLAGNGRFQQTLESLTIKVSHFFLSKHSEILGRMNLNLKRLNLKIPTYMSSREFPFSALNVWLKDLSSTLESLTLSLTNYWIRFPLKFLAKMNRLKVLHINLPEMFEVKDLIPLLKQLPVLESLTLIRATSTGVKREDFLAETFGNCSYPQLKSLEIMPEDFYGFTREYCQPSEFIPTLFPNLKKLSVCVYSKNMFLALIHNLKDVLIEDLRLYLRGWIMMSCSEIDKDFKTDHCPWGTSNPSFTSWKKLRKMSLIYNYNMSDECCLEEVYGRIPMEKILPSRLTTLELIDIGEVDLRVLIKLLEGLPLLLNLNISGKCGCDVIDEDGNYIELSGLWERIRNSPRIHPYLYVNHDYENTRDEPIYNDY